LAHQEVTSDTLGFRLSPQQLGLLERTGATAGAVQCAAILRPGIAADAVREALESAAAAHEILRTTFPRPAGMRGRHQVVHGELPIEWATGSVGPLAAVLDREAARPFDLDRGPVLRALHQPGGEDAVLVLTALAAAADPISLLRLTRAIGAPAAGGEEPVQFADYAEWRHALAAGEEDAGNDEGRAFWSRELEDLPRPPRILFSRFDAREPRPTATVPIALGRPLIAAVERAARSAGVSTAVFLEAAWHALLMRLSGAPGLVAVRWLDGRAQPDLDEAVGPYAQPAPIRSRLEPATSFAELVDQVHRAGNEAARQQDHAGAAEIDALLRAVPVGFWAVAVGELPAAVREIAFLSAPAPRQSLVLHCLAQPTATRLAVSYDSAAVDPADAVEIAARFPTLLASAAADAARPVAKLALTDAAERTRLLASASGPPAVRPADPVHELFEQRASEAPGRLAVTGPDGDALTYAELNERANRLAHHLRDRGVARGVTAGLCMERGDAMLVALLGILKAGGAYVPLNPEHPPARIREQLEQAGSALLVTHDHLLGALGSMAETVVCPERDADVLAGCSGSNPDHVAGPDDLAYVMYTSGSTGVPKGVGVTHGNLANYTAYMVERLAGDREPLAFAVLSAITTDLGNTVLFPALASGGTLHVIDPQRAIDGEALADYAREHPLDVIKIAPSHLATLLAPGPRAADALPRRWLITGGEVLTWELVAVIRALSPGCRLMNHYGPTEATIGCCTYDADATPRADAATVPIGRPVAGARVHVLDESLEPVPDGVPGELCVGGAGVAAGYVNAPEETGRRFVPDLAGEGRAYRTGDRVRRLRDGAIEFLGRLDDQVKIRGFRVEPGEIEAALARHPLVRQAAVIVDDAEGGDRRLVAYVVAAERPTADELRTFLAATLPDYMLPSAFALVDNVPVTASGKVDRRALAALAAVAAKRETSFVPPRDPVEEEIAAIWSELLGVDRVGVFDDFFSLGGHSLLATQAMIKIRRRHGEIPLRALLAASTVASLAEVVRSAGQPLAGGGAD
jgi:amino acid adenylation domain-containing protein